MTIFGYAIFSAMKIYREMMPLNAYSVKVILFIHPKTLIYAYVFTAF